MACIRFATATSGAEVSSPPHRGLEHSRAPGRDLPPAGTVGGEGAHQRGKRHLSPKAGDEACDAINPAPAARRAYDGHRRADEVGQCQYANRRAGAAARSRWVVDEASRIVPVREPDAAADLVVAGHPARPVPRAVGGEMVEQHLEVHPAPNRCASRARRYCPWRVHSLQSSRTVTHGQSERREGGLSIRRIENRMGTDARRQDACG